MNEKYLYIYNNLINYTRNKDLYKSLKSEESFSDRLTLFLLHFAFILKNFKNEENKIKRSEKLSSLFSDLYSSLFLVKLIKLL